MRVGEKYVLCPLLSKVNTKVSHSIPFRDCVSSMEIEESELSLIRIHGVDSMNNKKLMHQNGKFIQRQFTEAAKG